MSLSWIVQHVSSIKLVACWYKYLKEITIGLQANWVKINLYNVSSEAIPLEKLICLILSNNCQMKVDTLQNNEPRIHSQRQLMCYIFSSAQNFIRSIKLILISCGADALCLWRAWLRKGLRRTFKILIAKTCPSRVLDTVTGLCLTTVQHAHHTEAAFWKIPASDYFCKREWASSYWTASRPDRITVKKSLGREVQRCSKATRH